MARTKPSTAKSNPTTEQPATEAVTTEANEEAPVTTSTAEPTTETTEVVADQTATEAPAAEAVAVAEKPAEPDLTAFKASVDTALAAKDSADGTLPAEQIEAVKTQYQALDGLKAKNAAKKDLQDRLRAAITVPDVATAAAVMKLSDDACVAGGKSAAGPEKAPADPAQAYVDRLVALNLAYNLALNEVPEGVDADESRGKAADKVGQLADQADKLFTWTKADAETRGDEPDSNPLVKRAVKLVNGKVSGGSKAGGGTTHEGPRGVTHRHIQLFFKDQPVGTSAKVAEISKFKSEEYPQGNASPGAINSRLKSAANKSPIAGIEVVMVDGKMGARKTAEVEGL